MNRVVDIEFDPFESKWSANSFVMQLGFTQKIYLGESFF